MRKYIISLIVMFLFLPSLVSAKGEPPVYINYKVKVTNKDGISLIKDNNSINIPYDTVLEVIYEYEQDGKLYGNVEYNNNTGIIEISKVELLTKEIDLEKYKSESLKKIYIFDKGIYLYNGPSKAYGIVEGNIEIPIGTELSYTYGDEAWAYVTYNDIKGWIYIYPYDEIIYEKGAHIATIYNDKKFYTLKELKLLESPINNKEKGIVIPEYKEVSYKYVYSKDPYTTYYYLIYNDMEGWYKYEPLEVAEFYNEEFIVNATDDMDIYSSPLVTSNILGKINKNEEYNLLAIALKDSIDDNTYESWTYIKYKDTIGWLHYFEQGKEKVDGKQSNNTNVNNKKIEKNNDSIKIIIFSVSIIIIILFIMFTLLKLNNTKNDKSN